MGLALTHLNVQVAQGFVPSIFVGFVRLGGTELLEHHVRILYGLAARKVSAGCEGEGPRTVRGRDNALGPKKGALQGSGSTTARNHSYTLARMRGKSRQQK